MEELLIQTCQSFQLKASRTEDTGVWIQDRKIAALGIHISRHVSQHGFALNCSTDLSWFEHIIPCGIKDKSMTSLSKEVKKKVEIAHVLPILQRQFEQLFSCELRPLDRSQYKELQSKIKEFIS